MSSDNSPISPQRLAAASHLGTREARELFGNGAGDLEAFWDSLSAATREETCDLAEELDHRQIGLVVLGDPAYPDRLRGLRSPPPFLFVSGNPGLLARRGIGFSGSRAASEQVIATTTDCARRAVGAGFAVVSGFARGVDATAHRAALAGGGAAIAVLPEGILRARLAIDLHGDEVGPGEETVFVSQFPPNAPWMAGRAMARNGTVVALSECLVLVAARESGGSFEAGKAALKAGRRVLAPSWPDGPTTGVEALCQEGAELIADPAAFDEAIGSLELNPRRDTGGSVPGRLFELD